MTWFYMKWNWICDLESTISWSKIKWEIMNKTKANKSPLKLNIFGVNRNKFQFFWIQIPDLFELRIFHFYFNGFEQD